MTQARLTQQRGLPAPTVSISSGLTEAQRVLLWCGVHLLLGVAILQVPLVAPLHVAVVVLFGLVASLTRRTARTPLMFAGYVAGAEVLWRMTGGAPFWELGKFIVTLFLLIALARVYRHRTFVTVAGVTIFVLLIPSAVQTLDYFTDPMRARRALSFYLSGPLCLSVGLVTLASVRPQDLPLQRLIQWMVYPILTTATVVLLAIPRTGDVSFTAESSFLTSGNFGPNQVSGILGLGALLLFIHSSLTRNTRLRVLSLILALWLFSHAVLTFSRGGVLSAMVGVLAFAIHLFPNRRTRWLIVASGILVAVLMTWLILPRLNDFTQGNLQQRYASWETTGRVEIARGDLRLWSEHRLFGVGPGVSPRQRAVAHGHAAHTEFTRLLAEHGALGLLSITLLIAVCWHVYRMAPSNLAKAWVAACAAWSFSVMAHSAMRIAVSGLVCALAVVGASYYETRVHSRTRATPDEPPAE